METKISIIVTQANKNYNYFIKKRRKFAKNIKVRTYSTTFLDTNESNKFDFITAIYVFPHFMNEELGNVARKIYSMLRDEGKFVLVVANEKYLENKLRLEKDLFIEKNRIKFNNKDFN